jgi:hypothetical protein
VVAFVIQRITGLFAWHWFNHHMPGYYGMYSLGVEAFPRLVVRLKQLAVEIRQQDPRR